MTPREVVRLREALQEIVALLNDEGALMLDTFDDVWRITRAALDVPT